MNFGSLYLQLLSVDKYCPKKLWSIQGIFLAKSGSSGQTFVMSNNGEAGIWWWYFHHHCYACIALSWTARRFLPCIWCEGCNVRETKGETMPVTRHQCPCRPAAMPHTLLKGIKGEVRSTICRIASFVQIPPISTCLDVSTWGCGMKSNHLIVDFYF